MNGCGGVLCCVPRYGAPVGIGVGIGRRSREWGTCRIISRVTSQVLKILSWATAAAGGHRVRAVRPSPLLSATFPTRSSNDKFQAGRHHP